MFREYGKKFFTELCTKKFDVRKCHLETFILSEKDVSYFMLSSNLIRVVKIANKSFFFRECVKRISYEKYIHNAINQFCRYASIPSAKLNFAQEVEIQTYFNKQELRFFHEYLMSCWSESEFLKKISFLPLQMSKMRFSIWEHNYEVEDEFLYSVGMKSCPQPLIKILPLFFVYMRGVISAFREDLGEGEYDMFSACRTISSWNLAKCLGLQRLYSSAELVRLKIDREEDLVGVLCPLAMGTRAYDKCVVITPELQKEFISLKILDILCNQPDHWVNNYNVVVNSQGRAVSVCAFDNDNHNTFNPNPSISIACYNGGDSFFDKKGLIRVPYMDSVLAEKILQVKFDEIRELLCHYLTSLQLFCLRIRLKRLKTAIRQTRKKKFDFFADGCFSIETIRKEVEGEYGHTYLWQYCNHHQISIE